MIPGQNLKCQNPADVYLLLKSSDFISHDLDHAFDGCIDHEPSTLLSSSSAPTTNVDDTHDVAALSLDESAAEESESSTTRRILRPYSFELVLKKWFDMPKSQEWRCFVQDKQLLGKLLLVTVTFNRSGLTQSALEIHPFVFEHRHFSTRHDFLRFPSTRICSETDPHPSFLFLVRSRSRRIPIIGLYVSCSHNSLCDLLLRPLTV